MMGEGLLTEPDSPRSGDLRRSRCRGKLFGQTEKV